MKKPIIRIHDVATDEVIDREMTDVEFAQFETDKAAAQTEAEAVATKAAEKAALLAQLGISDDQAKLLLL
jgi:hypothetical protein